MIEQGLLSEVEVQRLFSYFWRPFGLRFLLYRNNFSKSKKIGELEVALSTKFFVTSILEEDLSKAAKVYANFLSPNLKGKLLRTGASKSPSYFANNKSSVYLTLNGKHWAFWFLLQWRFVFFRNVNRKNLSLKKKAIAFGYAIWVTDVAGFLPTRNLDLYNYRQRLKVDLSIKGSNIKGLSLFRI